MRCMSVCYSFMVIYLSQDSVFIFYSFQCISSAFKNLQRMYSHIATFAAHPNLPLITGSVDESSVHRLPYWYLATQGAWHGTEHLSELREHSS